MLVPCYARVGVKGTARQLGRIRLNEAVIGMSAGHCGSYHILAMDKHYLEYVITGSFPSLPSCVGLTPTHPFVALANKQRAAGVTGNIGEAVTGVVARRVLDLKVGEFVHVKPKQGFGRRKSPDYLFRVGPKLPGPFAKLWPPPLSVPLPTWWPVESKARNSPKAADDAVEAAALAQLASFWHTIQNGFPQDVGFGMAVSLAYETSSRVMITLFLPRNQSKLLTHLASAKHPKFMADFSNDTVTRSALYGC
jgi:hypothetical protein